MRLITPKEVTLDVVLSLAQGRCTGPTNLLNPKTLNPWFSVQGLRNPRSLTCEPTHPKAPSPQTRNPQASRAFLKA